ALSDVYGAWWFIGGFALLAVSLLACSARRASQLLRRRESIRQVSRAEVLARPHVLERRVELEAAAAAARLREGLRNAGYALRGAEAQESAEGLTARRGLATAWVSVVIHVGMVLVLVGAAYGRFPSNSYQAVADLSQGESYEVQTGGDTFSLRLLDAGQERDPEGRPTRFWAKAEILEEGKVVKSGLIEPNQPFIHRGVIAVLQSLSSTGYSVDVSKGETTASVPVVLGPDGAVAMMETVTKLQDPPWVVFIHDFRSAATDEEAAPAAKVFVDPSGDLSHNWEPIGWVDEEGLTYSGVRFRLSSGGRGAQLQLDRDIGVPIVWLGFCVISLGLIPLLGVRQRTLVAFISGRGDFCKVLVGASDAGAERDATRALDSFAANAADAGQDGKQSQDT
ncbi:MAG: cytochrome c biogenesis protein ResB, partial [Armatimonadetes bacterium]|nr:cytochrome c biogenesis protein ResB [Armatimonadota bacterium]